MMHLPPPVAEPGVQAARGGERARVPLLLEDPPDLGCIVTPANRGSDSVREFSVIATRPCVFTLDNS